MVGSRLNVHLYRDSFNTPWGFRLQGGKDLSQPLIVQRVFSNSPAEGELQRGDIILSINSRDASQLTHKQAQDLIKHGGGQVQLIVNRPPPGTQIAPLSPPIVTQRPRAPSLQPSMVSNLATTLPKLKVALENDSTPATHNFLKARLDRLRSEASPSPEGPPSRSLTIVVAQQPSYSALPAQRRPVPVMQPLHVQAPASPQYHQIQRQRSTQSQPPITPTPSTPVPPWAAQQFEPKKVSKLSKLGGGGLSFGTDYCTLPRRSASSAQYGGGRYHTQSQSSDGPDNVEPDRLATGPPPKVCSLRNLGGGGYDFGTSFGSATLPRRNTGRRYSQPPSMPGSAGHHPKKVNLSKLGGGGPEFGADFGHRSHEFYGQTAAQRYEPTRDNEKSVMLNRVQSSLDNITLSPRTPEVQPTSPFYQPSYQPQPQPPSYQPQPSYQPSYPYPDQTYTPTGLLLEQQRLQDQQYQQQQDEVRTPLNKPPPKVPKPKPGQTSYSNFGTSYGPTKKTSTSNWRPAPAFKPTPAPVSAPQASYTPTSVQYAPKPSPPMHSQVPGMNPASWQAPEDDNGPAWRNTLKATGVKPWEQETGYALQQDPVRSVPYHPTPTPKAAPFSPTLAPENGGADGENGPKVVHLQYNSPMGLYSNQNVAETLQGQTLALSGQITKPPPPATNESGERDWSQSAVLRFINQEETRNKPKNPPAVSPKPKLYSPVHSPAQPQNYYEEIGASDF